MIQPELKEKAQEMNRKLKLSAQGFKYLEDKKPNAFLTPNDPNAIFYQREVPAFLDFRSINNPFSG